MSDLSPQGGPKRTLVYECRPYPPLHTVRTWSQKADCRPHKASFQDLGLRDLCRRGWAGKVTPKKRMAGFAQDFFRARSAMRAGALSFP